jgi:hypothetical protein
MALGQALRLKRRLRSVLALSTLLWSAPRARHLDYGEALGKTLCRPTTLQIFVVDFRLRARDDFPTDVLNP